MTRVCLVSVTPDAEKTMGYVARVSNPKNQDNPSVEGLLSYCIKHNHWSVFEQAFMTLEINTTRAIAAQVLRHRSFTFQEFSQRYADAGMLGDIPTPDLAKFDAKIEEHFFQAQHIYNEMLEEGIAKECARMVLPLATPTRIYMSGSVRSWLHYIELRSANGTQKEHMDIANLCKEHLICQFPIVAKAMGWCAEDKECGCPDDWDDLQPCLKIL